MLQKMLDQQQPRNLEKSGMKTAELSAVCVVQ